MSSELAGKRVLVIGLGLFGGGVAATRHCVRQGARVTVTDLRDARALAPSIRALDGCPVRYRLGGQWVGDVLEADLVVANPGVPEDSPLLQAARRRGVPITAELNLFIEACPTPWIAGITGTNGKSTTAAMCAAMSAAGPHRTWLGGNIGRSLLDDLHAIGPDDRVVLEISSFQLDALRPLQWSPRVAVFTTFTPNHLDRHPTLEHYLDAKREIYLHQSPFDTLVLGADDPTVAALADEARGEVVATSVETPGIDPQDVPLPGRHNLANAAMAAAAARALGTPTDAVATGLREFRGLPHRLERVAQRDDVRFWNDSIATNPESVYVALTALEALGGPIHWIGGGAGKNLDLRPLAHRLARRVAAAYCIGTEGPRIAELLRTFRGPRPLPSIVEVPTLDRAVAAAAVSCPRGGHVLLSPACASFDQFANFAARGDAFRAAVQALPQATASRAS